MVVCLHHGLSFINFALGILADLITLTSGKVPLWEVLHCLGKGKD